MIEHIAEHIDQQRWLLNNGLITDEAKNNIYVYGTLVHSDIQAVDVAIDVEKKAIYYVLFAPKSFIKRYKKFLHLKDATSLFSLLKLKFLLKRRGNLNIGGILRSFITDYCGPTWSVSFELKDIKEYKDEPDKDT
jgi:hypothetical protein